MSLKNFNRDVEIETSFRRIKFKFQARITFEAGEDSMEIKFDQILLGRVSQKHKLIVNQYYDEVYFTNHEDTVAYLEINTNLDEVENSDRAMAYVKGLIKDSFIDFIHNIDRKEKEDAGDDMTPISDTDEDDNEPQGDVDKIIFNTVKRAMGNKGTKAVVDNMIKDLIKEHGIVPHRKILEVKFPNLPKKDVGLQHYKFEEILKTVSAGVNIALVGPAGSGKTTIVSNVAKILEKPFASQSVSAQSTTFDFFGYKSATGDYVPTLFREKYENGGVFLLDEFDAGNPNVLAALNQAIANDEAPFPDKMVAKHKDFLIVMAGNTYGTGATLDYVGRSKLDAATLDRFAFIDVDYDENLEKSLCFNDEWCNLVQAYRKKAREKKIRCVISPRATFNGEKLIAAGIDFQRVLEMTVFKGLNENELNLLK